MNTRSLMFLKLRFHGALVNIFQTTIFQNMRKKRLLVIKSNHDFIYVEKCENINFNNNIIE